MNAINSLSLKNGIDPQQATIFIEMLNADKCGLLTNDVSQLKKDLQEFYLYDKLAKGCVSKQMCLQTRYQFNPSPLKKQKSLMAQTNVKKERKVNTFFAKEESCSEFKLFSNIIDGCH